MIKSNNVVKKIDFSANFKIKNAYFLFLIKCRMYIEIVPNRFNENVLI